MNKNEKLEALCNIQNTLIENLSAQIHGDICNVDTHEAYEIVDIIKDISETKKYCMEAAYYKKVVDAMDDVDPAYGYNANRYASGRYAPKGHGNYTGRMGYRPFMDQEPYIDAYLHDPNFHDKMKRSDMNYGYNEHDLNRDVHHMSDRYGKSFNDYREAKRHYTASHSAEDMNEMNVKANEHLADTIATMREIWSNADTTQKKRMKTDLQALLNEMAV